MGKKIKQKSKKISVTDEKGNRHVLKATVISANVEQIRKTSSQRIEDEKFESILVNEKIIKPPLNQSELSILPEISSELPQDIEAMAIGVEGFGARLISKIPQDSPLLKNKKIKERMNEEKSWIKKQFMDLPNPEQSLKYLRIETRKDQETTGNGYWELVPSTANPKRYGCYNKVDAGTMWITRVDKRKNCDVPQIC